MKPPFYVGDVNGGDATWWAIYDGAAARSHGEELSAILGADGLPEQRLGGLAGVRFHGGGPEGRYLLWRLDDGIALVEDQAFYLSGDIKDPSDSAVGTVVAGIERLDPEPMGNVEVASGVLLLWEVYELEVDELPATQDAPVVGTRHKWIWIPVENGIYEVSYTVPELRHAPTGVEIDEIMWLSRV